MPLFALINKQHYNKIGLISLTWQIGGQPWKNRQ